VDSIIGANRKQQRLFFFPVLFTSVAVLMSFSKKGMTFVVYLLYTLVFLNYRLISGKTV
jgi:hypothetical protein